MIAWFLTVFGVLVCFWLAWMPITTKMNNRRVNELRLKRVEKLIEFNRSAKCKDDFIELYLAVTKALNTKMNITKEEFERLSIESVRKLNEEALNDIKEQLQAA